MRYILQTGVGAGLRQWDGIDKETDELLQIVDPSDYELAHQRLIGLRPGAQI